MRIGRAEIGRRAFLGNSGMTAPGRSVPDGGLVGVLSATPKKAKKGSSYLGLPPVKLPRSAERRRPEPYVRPARAAAVGARPGGAVPDRPGVLLGRAGRADGGGARALLRRRGPGLLRPAWCCSAPVRPRGCCPIVAKWLLVGRHRTGEHPLWSGFVWRNELADTFVEVVAVPWLAGSVPGTPLMTLWLRGLGARIGKGVWVESYWLPETDLVTLGDAATREPRLCAADPPLPRPDLADGYCGPP